MISPLRSQILGVIVSVVTGTIVFVVVWKLLAYALSFWYIGDVLGPSLGVVFGGLSAFEMFTRQQRETPINWVGVSLFLGKPTGRMYENGIHWVPPFFGILNCPASEKKFIIEMFGQKINAQDGATIFFGISEQEGKRNRIQYSVIDPILYIATDDPENAIQGAYLEESRLFFGQMSKAIGVKNHKNLFSDFIVLPPKTEPDAQKKHNEFKANLQEAKFWSADNVKEEHLFSFESVRTIMDKAGNFREKNTIWGIGNIVAFIPNARENPEAEKAATQKQVAIEQVVALETRATTIMKLAKEMSVDAGVNPDLAVTMVAGLSGQKVDIKNKTINVSGFPEVISELGKLAIEKLAKKDK